MSMQMLGECILQFEQKKLFSLRTFLYLLQEHLWNSEGSSETVKSGDKNAQHKSSETYSILTGILDKFSVWSSPQQKDLPA